MTQEMRNSAMETLPRKLILLTLMTYKAYAHNLLAETKCWRENTNSADSSVLVSDDEEDEELLTGGI